MEPQFYFNQFKFITKILDRDLHKGLCLTMCIDFIYNKRNNLQCDFLYFSQIYKFASRQRALDFGVTSGKIKDAALIPNGKVDLQFKKFISYPLNYTKMASALLNKDDYIITIFNSDDSGHCIAFRNRNKMELFDPNNGMFVLDFMSELISFINTRYQNKGVYIYKCLTKDATILS